MTDRCVMCGKFIPAYGEEHCNSCLETLETELREIESGIGTGSCGKADNEYCRHMVDRATNQPYGTLTWSVEGLR